MQEFLRPGEILLGDRAYSDYVTLAILRAQTVDVLDRLPARRKVDFRKAKKRLGQRDAFFQWKKGWQQSDLLSSEQWASLPEEITVRVIGFEAVIRGRKQRVRLVTTLLDPASLSSGQTPGFRT